ncbi:MAG: hypothetical protein FJ009_14070 [Chloroflexi bacterium]|nr:hypothetical protein [Chloroflexota bacterium]
MSRRVKSKVQKKDWRRYVWIVLAGSVVLSMILGSLLPFIAPNPAYSVPTPTPQSPVPATPTPRAGLDILALGQADWLTIES